MSRSTGPSIVTVAAERWRDFWFTSEPLYALGLVRIVLGVNVFVWNLISLPDLYNLFGRTGVLPHPAVVDFRWSLFQLFDGDTALLVGWWVLLAAALALTVGWHSRAAAVVVLVMYLSFTRRNYLVFNSADGLLGVLLVIIVVSACGAALSLDQRRRTGSFWTAQDRSRWPIRLLQVQLSLIYFVAVQSKLTGTTWQDGSAVSYAWRTDLDRAILPVPQWMWDNPYIVNVATWGALLIELSIAVLVWNRRCRPYVLAAGVVLHTVIMLTQNVGFFSLAMFTLYLAFIPWPTVQRMPATVKAYWARVRRRPAETPAD